MEKIDAMDDARWRSYALEQAKLCLGGRYTVEELLDAADEIYAFLVDRQDPTLH